MEASARRFGFCLTRTDKSGASLTILISIEQLACPLMVERSYTSWARARSPYGLRRKVTQPAQHNCPLGISVLSQRLETASPGRRMGAWYLHLLKATK